MPLDTDLHVNAPQPEPSPRPVGADKQVKYQENAKKRAFDGMTGGRAIVVGSRIGSGRERESWRVLVMVTGANGQPVQVALASDAAERLAAELTDMAAVCRGEHAALCGSRP